MGGGGPHAGRELYQFCYTYQLDFPCPARPPGAHRVRPGPPGSLAAELCLLLSNRARDGGLAPGELRAAAEAVAEAASAAGLRVPPVVDLWTKKCCSD